MTKDWNFNQPLESKSENQEDPDKIAALFGNHQGGNDVFKKLIHRLSDMSVQDLEKIDRLLDIIFTPDQGSEELKTEATYREATLDDTLKEAKNQLHKEQLEKKLERFRKNGMK